MLTNCLTNIICSTFKAQGLLNQNQHEVPAHRSMMLIEFNRRIDPEIEDGYRRIELVLYAPTNYILVAARQAWTVLDVRGLNQNAFGEWIVPKDRDYVSGQGTFMRFSYHESCWRTDGVGRVINAIERKVMSIISSWNGWFTIVPASEEIIKLCSNVDGTKGRVEDL